MGRGQVSVEYLVLVGLALGVLVPAIIFFLSYAKSGEQAGTAAQVNEIGLEMIAAAKSTYALGVNARQTLDFTMPETVASVRVNGAELTITYLSGYGTSDAVFFSTINLSTNGSAGEISSAHAGVTRYRFVSHGANVSIVEVT